MVPNITVECFVGVLLFCNDPWNSKLGADQVNRENLGKTRAELIQKWNEANSRDQATK